MTQSPINSSSPNPESTPEFNAVEHLQSVCRQVVNTLIREDFNDINSDIDETDIKTSRPSLRRACLHEDKDSLLMTVARLLTYYLVATKARRLQRPVYGEPTADKQEDLTFRPEVFLYFEQDSNLVSESFSPINAEIRFRLTNEESETINPTKAKALAIDVKRIFAPNGRGITWDKGKVLCTYLDKKLGYNFQVYAASELEAEEIMKKVMSVRSHTFDETKFTPHNPRKKSVTNPTTTRKVYGKQVKDKRWRPTARVRFLYASLKIDGVDEDVMLIDTRDRFNDILGDPRIP